MKHVDPLHVSGCVLCHRLVQDRESDAGIPPASYQLVYCDGVSHRAVMESGRMLIKSEL